MTSQKKTSNKNRLYDFITIIHIIDHKRAKKYKKANKSERRMPWLKEAMKDVISCDKSGVGANNL